MRTAPGTPALQRAREVLGAWLPGRAASRVLERALEAEGLTPATVDDERVARLLVGRVYRELRGTVPRRPLRHDLERLARSLRRDAEASRAAPEADAAAPDGATPDDVRPDEDTTHARTPSEVTPNDVRSDAALGAPAIDGEQRRGDDAPAAGSAVRHADGVPRAPAPLDPEAVLMALATLDGVDGVAVFDGTGRLHQVRGERKDIDAMGRVIAASGELLGRHGALRSLCITADAGALVAVPVPPRWLAVRGRSDMNLGAVYAALSALEEER